MASRYLKDIPENLIKYNFQNRSVFENPYPLKSVLCQSNHIKWKHNFVAMFMKYSHGTLQKIITI
jgi:hypothetical protein